MKVLTQLTAFYHINDVHAHLDEFRASGTDCTNKTLGCFGGYARVKTVIEESRKGHNDSLFLNVGDEFQVRLTICLVFPFQLIASNFSLLISGHPLLLLLRWRENCRNAQPNGFRRYDTRKPRV